MRENRGTFDDDDCWGLTSTGTSYSLLGIGEKGGNKGGAGVGGGVGWGGVGWRFEYL